MRRFPALEKRLSAVPPKWVQLVAILLVGILAPVYIIFVNTSWKQNWTFSAFLALGVYVVAIGGFALMALGVTGGQITSPETDKRLAERLNQLRLPNRYRWAVVGACVLYIAIYALFRIYA